MLNLEWEALNTLRCSRHQTFVAPTFSWASRSGAVIWYMNLENGKRPSAQSHEFASLLECSCIPSGSDSSGKLFAGQITIRGYVVEMAIVDVTPNNPMEESQWREEALRRIAT